MPEETTGEPNEGTNQDQELLEKHIAFFNAVREFTRDPEICAIIEERHKRGVDLLMDASSRLWEDIVRGETFTEFYKKDERVIAKYFRCLRGAKQFIRNAEINPNHKGKHFSEWGEPVLRQTAISLVGKSVIHVRDQYEDLIEGHEELNDRQLRIRDTLRDICLRNPGDTEVTAENVLELVEMGNEGYENQDDYWTVFNADLQADAQDPEGDPEAKALVETVRQAAERCGLFAAIDDLKKKKPA